VTQPTFPGIYVDESWSGARSIAPVPTGIAAMLAPTERGALAPKLVTSYGEYEKWFGCTCGDASFAAYAAEGFFENGGKQLFVCRLVGKQATAAIASFGNFVATAVGPGSWGCRVWVRIDASSADAPHAGAMPSPVRMRVAYWQKMPDGGVFDPFDDASNEERRRSFPPTWIEDFQALEPLAANAGEDPRSQHGDESTSMFVTLRATSAAARGEWPVAGSRALADGVDDAHGLDDSDFQGEPAGKRTRPQGLAALETDACRDVDLIYSPAATESVARLLVDHCERVRYRFAVIDAPPPVPSLASMDPRVSIRDSTRAACYYPWIVVADPHDKARRQVPPGGHVLGVYARVDNERGVFKAPANEIVRGALALSDDVTDRLQAALAAKGVNVIREFVDRGIRIWGARTLSSDKGWQYVNVRRLLLFLERSIEEGLRWVVFEANDAALWTRVRDAVRSFLSLQWRGGALAGATENDAFFVTCDQTTMTQQDIVDGRLVCEVGVAPLRPSEFVMFRVSQRTAEAQR